MTKAIRIHQHGGPEELRWDDVDPGTPGSGQALIRQTAAGLNFIDVYHRTGLYPVPAMPAVIGNEAAGVVEEVGDGVSDLQVGDRVAYCMSLGGYAERRVIEVARLVKIPDGITDQQAAAMMLKGCTAQYLLRRIYPVKAGDTILLHAAAGGVGLIAAQWAKHLGATVIGTVGSDAKAELARATGATMRSCTPGKTWSRVSRRSPTAPAFRWCSTRSGKTPSWRPSTVYSRAG
jgi:NADPH2:quinone reductase